jgi:succinate dehydrogenase / fumarate reductase, flavoprotein subunit
VPVLNRCVGAKILAADDEPTRVMGLFAFHAADRTAQNPLGLAVIRCADLVIAAGGPGELYRDSVHPKHCFGALGLALEAGVRADRNANKTKAYRQFSTASAHLA